MAVHANVTVVLGRNKEAEKKAEPVVETPVEREPEPKGLFAHKHSQFLNDMLKEQN